MSTSAVVMMGALPSWVWGAGALQLVLMAVGVWVWLRTDPSRFTMNRWAWLAVTIVLSIMGPIAFLAFGRRPATVDHAPAVDARSGERVADLLYGAR